MSDGSKRVLITGCSTGIGRETALHLSRNGWPVIATARKPEALSDLAEAGCETLALDVTDEPSMQAAVAAAGPLYALVNNAGYSQSGAIESVALDSVRRQFETNVFGLIRMCQLVLPGMREAGTGRIVNISSMGGKLVFPGGGAYHATKFAVEAFSDAMRFEVAGFGVKVIIIEPGLITTNFDQAAKASMDLEDDGTYADFNRTVASQTEGVYKGPMKLLGGGPDAVAKVIEKALDARRPRTRYTVTPSARMALTTRGLMTDRMWDRAMRTQFRQPS